MKALFAILFCVTMHAQVTAVFNSAERASLRYRGTEYLADGTFRLNGVQFQGARGVHEGSVRGACSANAGQMRCGYEWGTITPAYHVGPDRLNLAITIENTTVEPVTGIFLEPLVLRLPAKPREYDGVTPMLETNIGEPAVVRLTGERDAVTLVDEDEKPLMVGFPFAADRPGPMQVFPLRINTGVDRTYPDSLPLIDRPIAPHGTETFRLSLRFSAATESPYRVAEDVYRNFATQHQQTLRWADRRPIASLILGTTAARWPGNPRGWLLDSSVDALTPEGIRSLRERVLNWARTSIFIMRQMNAQGMITWDIEGEEWPQPTTYLGDPRVFEKAAPEMRGIADEYFKLFRDAGFRVGVCVRPQRLIWEGGVPHQARADDTSRVLIEKIEYAKRRWSATLFYVDSNGEPNRPMAASVFEQVAAAEPDVLLIPEHETLAYYASTAPYRELRLGHAITRAQAREVFPGAFSVINIADGDLDQNRETLARAIEAGDLILFRGWFNDPANAKARALYEERAHRNGPVPHR